MEAKVPKGRVHDPYSYEIETWTQTQSHFPRSQRVVWMKPRKV
jgi:tetrathionate reductase subunit B